MEPERRKGEFEGKVAIITGAGRGLGWAYAQYFCSHGARVVLNDLADRAGQATQLKARVAFLNDAYPGAVVGIAGDVSEQSLCADLVRAAVSVHGGLHIVVANAGTSISKPFSATTRGEVDRLFNVHVGGHWGLVSAAWPRLVGQGFGRVVMTASTAGLLGLPNGSAYAAAKGAIVGLTKSLAQEAEGSGVLVNAICPGAYTQMAVDAMDEEYLEQMRRHFSPDVVAPVVGWLAHEQCSLNGVVLDVRGGGLRSLFTGATAGVYSEELSLGWIAEKESQVCDMAKWTAPRTTREAAEWVLALKEGRTVPRMTKVDRRA